MRSGRRSSPGSSDGKNKGIRSCVVAHCPRARGGWFGVFAPAGTSPEILNRVHAEVRTPFANALFRERLETLGSEPVGNPPAEFKQFVSAKIRKYAEIVRLANIRPE